MSDLVFYPSYVVLQQVDTTVLGLSDEDARKNPYIASMGVYVFRTDLLLKLLTWSYPSCNDFGSEIIPSAVKDYKVQVRSILRNNFYLSLFFMLHFRKGRLSEMIELSFPMHPYSFRHIYSMTTGRTLEP